MTSRQLNIMRLRRQISEAERKIRETEDAGIKRSQTSAIHSWSQQIQSIEENIKNDPTLEERQAEELRHEQALARILAKDPTGIKRF